MNRRHPRSPLFPYTTLSRSSVPTVDEIETTMRPTRSEIRAPASTRAKMSRPSSSRPNQCVRDGPSSRRSEEHTSELQSPDHLVCRLLLEKKKVHVAAAVCQP